MASYTSLGSKITFRLDSGEVKNGRVVYKTFSLSNIDGSKPVGDLAACAEFTIGLIGPTCDRVTLTRNDVIEL